MEHHPQRPALSGASSRWRASLIRHAGWALAGLVAAAALASPPERLPCAVLTGALLSKGLCASPAAQDAPNFITLNYWPVDAPRWHVLDYPDTQWTWDFLGLNPGKGCPPYLIHDRDKSLAYWRDPAIPEDIDWAQASRGGRWVSCYRGHAGTDIAAAPYAPVYAVADGEIVSVKAATDSQGANAVIVIHHRREIAGYVGDWTARYVHLENKFPVAAGRVVEGQLIGFVANRGKNTHLHYEMRDLWDCQSPCIVNPWGPTFLFFDDDQDRRPDPASSVAPPAPPGQELIRNGDFSAGWQGWMALSGSGEATQGGALRLSRPDKWEDYAGVQQAIPYAFPAGTSFELAVTLSNLSDSPQSAWVSLRDVRGFDRMAGCVFALPPDSPPTLYALRAETGAAWANLIALISARVSSERAAVVVEDASLRAFDGKASASCISKPARLRGASPT